MKTLALFLIMTSFLPRHVAEQRPSQHVKVPAIVSVDGICTGFVAHPNVVYTAAHCVLDALSSGSHFVTVTFLHGQQQQFYIAGNGDPDHRDYAVLFGDTLGIEPMPIAAGGAKAGAFCVTAGYGGGSPVQNATVCKIAGMDDGMINFYGNIIPGDSGSPLLDANTGEVVGIVVRSRFPVPEAWASDVRYAEIAYAQFLDARHFLPTIPSPR